MSDNDESLVNMLSEMWKTTLVEIIERDNKTNELLRRLAIITMQIVEGKWDGRVEAIYEHEQPRESNNVEAHDGQAAVKSDGGN